MVAKKDSQRGSFLFGVNQGRRRLAPPHFDAAKGFYVSHFAKAGQMRIAHMDMFQTRIKARILMMQMRKEGIRHHSRVAGVFVL
jgi:hypothetical protein